MRSPLTVVMISVFVVLSAPAQTTTALLDTVQHSSFNYFWYEANSSNGLIKDRNTSGSPCSIASVGFGLSSICIAVDHGWITREAARDRVVTTLRTFWEKPQGVGASGFIGYKGLFYHFLDMNSATRTWESELSTIDTGLLFAGILDAKQYFTGNDSVETQIRALADSIYYRADWEFMRNGNAGILMGWKPGTEFSGYGQWIGYNEAMILYILALGSPTHPVGSNAWQQWTTGYRWQTMYGQSYLIFAPLFGHQYTHCWVDFRNIRDGFMQNAQSTYFETSRRATLAQRTYSIANPGHWMGYSDSLWGLTAGDGPNGYIARGAPPAQNDDGTISPTAPVSSLPFAPEVVIPTIRNMWNAYRSQLWVTYGFRDAFNLIRNWWGPDVIGIDAGPMVMMIENYRTQAVWNRFMQNADIQRGLLRAGSSPIVSVDGVNQLPMDFALEQNYPNPFNPTTRLSFVVGRSSYVSLKIFDLLGRVVATLVSETKPAGRYNVEWDAADVTSGVYFYRFTAGSFTQTRKMILAK
ncbi:MAG: glucoamylase family protein [bacterium]